MSATGSDALNAHYGDDALFERIVAALVAAGRDPEHPTRDDLVAFDEFHGGGRASTRELARVAGCASGMQVLDVGSGIGGPARTLAAEFGCSVTGVDITASFVAAATILSERMGMDEQVRFRVASATELPFEDASFDRVWSQNVVMNVAAKDRCFAEMARVLRPGGRVALEMNVRSGDAEPVYPTFWADEPELSHLVSAGDARALLEDVGLTVERMDDLTASSVAMAEKRQQAAAAAEPSPLGMQVLVRRHLKQKFANGLRNYREGRTQALQIIAAHP